MTESPQQSVSAGRRVLGALWRAVTSLPGRVLISAALLAAVAVSIDLGAVLDALESADWASFAAAVGLVVVSLALGGLRWQPLLVAAEVPASVAVSVRAYFAGTFANNLLPTGFGGDFVRGWLVARSGRPLARALTAVLFDRASSLACLVLVGWIGVIANPDALPAGLIVALAVLSGGGCALAAAGLLALRRSGLGRFLPERLRPWAAEVAMVLRRVVADRPLQLRLLALGVAFQLLMVMALKLIAVAIGISVSFSVLAVVTPLVLIATLAPISVAGFGVREGGFVALLDGVGVSAADATLLSLLSVAALALASLPGGVVLATAGGSRPSGIEV